MERFIHEQILGLFRRLLAEKKDMNEERRQLILKLLADEESKDGIDASVRKCHMLPNVGAATKI